MSTSDLQVVLGASGGTGSAIVRELAERGFPVRAVNRGGDTDVPGGVVRFKADVATFDGAAAACASAAVVYHCAKPAYNRWAAEFPTMNEAIIAGAARAEAKLVFADNLYMYGPIEGPISEDTPQRPTSTKGQTRLALADRLVRAHETGILRTTMGRSSDYYGPRGTDSIAGKTLFGAVLDGKAVQWPGNPDAPRTLHYLGDMARGLVTLGVNDEADGQAWILPAAPPLTPRQFIAMAGTAAGKPARVRPVSKLMMRVAGLFIPPAREIPDIWYQYVRHFTVDASRFEQTFGPSVVTPHAEAIDRTMAWYRNQAVG